MSAPTLQQIISHTKAYGFLYNSSDIYEGLQAVYDYGHCGVLLKNKVKEFWWKSMVQLHTNIVGLDAAILMSSKVWEASGHVGNFHDWMVDNKDSKKRYRVDVLIEEKAAEWERSGEKEKAEKALEDMNSLLEVGDGDGLSALLTHMRVVCPLSKTAKWTTAKKFNLMFSTQVGAVAKESHDIYLRPETAQGIFVNFLNIQKTTRMSLPFGVAQIGKAFRNEIVARQFTFRTREFEQMEMQFFVSPEASEEWFSHWTKKRHMWYEALGIRPEQIRTVPHKQLSHYAKAAVDLEYTFPFGFKEVEGIHARGDFDLSSHARHAKKKLSYFDPKEEKTYTPYVIETSAGCDRITLMLLCASFRKVTEESGERVFLAFPPPLAPMGAAVLPLLKKKPFIDKAKEIFNTLRFDFSIAYDESGSIGKRYTRQDLVGTPYCITVDHETLEDEHVTIRERDTMLQERVAIKELHAYLSERLSMANLLEKLVALEKADSKQQ